jgi:potassium voltage-gated channel Eag-related subfamily H protein 7
MEEEPLGVLGEGSFFGETSLLTNEPCSTYVRAQSITELAYLTKGDFKSITEKFPTFHLAVKRISDSRKQTASNVQRMARTNRGRTGSFAAGFGGGVEHDKKIYGLRTATRIAVWLKKARETIEDENTLGDLGTDAHLDMDTNRKSSLGNHLPLRRKTIQIGAIDSKYLDNLSLCQARHLANIREVKNIKAKFLEEENIKSSSSSS